MAQQDQLLLSKIAGALTAESPTTGAVVNLGTRLAGEDIDKDVMKGEVRSLPHTISNSATISIIQSTAGWLHTVVIGMNSCPTTTIYDNASGASGTILFHAEPTTSPQSYVVDVSFVNGATAWLTAGNSPRINVNTRD